MYLSLKPSSPPGLTLCVCAMDSSKDDLIEFEFPQFIRVYKNGRVERLRDTEFVPTSLDPHTRVASKDVLILPDFDVSARLYLPPNLTNNPHKLPLVVYFHGGGFCISSAFSPAYHNYLVSLVLKANVVAISIDYRLAPEHLVPIAYEDSWNGMKWVASHCKGNGPEAWLNEFADFDRVFLAGDSAGANIAHKMAMLAGENEVGQGMKLHGIALVHPYFWGSESIGCEASDPRKPLVDNIWPFVCNSMLDNDDPYINPMAPGAPRLSNLGCSRLLVFVAEKDILKYRGLLYFEAVKHSGWVGEIEIMETEGEDHIFHLDNQTCQNAEALMSRLSLFLNKGKSDMK